MINWSDSAILYGMFFQHTNQLGLKWRDADRLFALNLKAKTAQQTMELVNTGKLTSGGESRASIRPY